MSKADEIEEIRQLSYKYFLGWDADDVDATVNVFTVDGVNDQSGVDSFVLRGQDEIRNHFLEWRTQMTHSFHMVGNIIIEFDDGDNAHGTNCQDGVAIMKDGAVLSGKHYFEDKYVRTPQGWRIAVRKAFGMFPES